MGKTVGKIALGAAIIGAAFVTGGASLVPTLTATATGGALSIGLATTALGSTLLVAGASMALSGIAQGVGIGPKVPKATLGRLNLTFDPNAPRKMVLGGPTAMGTDLVYSEPSGTDQEYVDYIIVVAAHKVASIDSIYTDDKLMWSSVGGVQSPYTGYLTVNTRTEGAAGNAIAINGGTTWSTDCRLTGCAYVHLRIKRTGNDKKATSPFAGGLSSRLTIIGKGMPVYDPRYDSTRGGSGSMRADDQSTWAFTVSGNDVGCNTAAQTVTSLIGWKIGGKVSVGAGLPLARIDFDDFITAANVCDESVSIAGGGTQRRYVTAGIFDDDDAPSTVMEALCLHMNAEPRDTSGKLGVFMKTNDLSGSLLELTEDDILGAVQWDDGPGLEDGYNIVRGRRTDASTASLYQLAPYAAQSYTSLDGVNRALPLDLPLFDDDERAQRVAAQVLNRGKFQGRLTSTFGPRALAAPAGTPVRLTFAGKGFVSKLFRVERQDIRVAVDEGRVVAFCPMVLVEEDASIYTVPTTTAASAPVAVPSFDPLNQTFIQSAVEIGRTADLAAAAGDNLCINPWLADGLTDGLFPESMYPSGPPVVVTVQLASAINGAGMTAPNPYVMQIEGVGSDQFGNGPVLYDGAARAGDTFHLDALFGRYAAGNPYTANGGLFIIFWAQKEDGTNLDYSTSRSVEVADVPGATFVRRSFSYQCPSNTGRLTVSIGTKAALSATRTWLTVGWRVARTQLGADVTVEQPVVSQLDPVTGRGESRRLLGQFSGSSVDRIVSTNPLAASASAGTATITVNAHTEYDDAGSLAFTSATITGLAESTLYYVYEDNPNYTAGARSYVATTDRTAIAAAGRRYVGAITTPASGGSSTGEGGTGGGWSGDGPIP